MMLVEKTALLNCNILHFPSHSSGLIFKVFKRTDSEWLKFASLCVDNTKHSVYNILNNQECMEILVEMSIA